MESAAGIRPLCDDKTLLEEVRWMDRLLTRGGKKRHLLSDDNVDVPEESTKALLILLAHRPTSKMH